MHFLSAIAHSETRLPNLLWNDTHTVLQVDGSPLIISAIKDMVKSLLARANQLIALLCEGVDMTDYDRCLEKHLNVQEASHWPKDPLRKHDDGYSFIQDPGNPFQAFQEVLLRGMFQDPNIFDKYHVWEGTCSVFKQGKLNVFLPKFFYQYVVAAVARWFTHLAELHDVAFSLVHVTSGGPARGTELETYRLINTRESPRTLYFVGGQLTFITGYNKSRQRTEYPDKYVARPIYPPVVRTIMYLAGPLNYVAQSWLHAMDSKAPRLGPEVFMHFGKALRSEDFSNILQYQTAQHLHVPMGLRMWRQMIKALLRRIVNIDFDDEGDQADDALDEMFGHTTSTGRSRYGLTWNDLPTLHEDMIAELFKVSKRFWAWLGDQTSKAVGPRPDISYSEIHEAVSITLGKLQLTASQQTAIIQDTASSHARVLQMLQVTHEKIDRTHQAILHSQRGQPSSLVQPMDSLDIGFSRIHGLRLYLQNSSAMFKSIQQALAIESISRGYPHVLIVLPTGGGKSAIYASPGFVEKAGFRLVIIPYRSLFDQATQDARSKGLPYAVFPSNDIDLFRCRIVFVSLERCVQDDFRTWCIANRNANLLRGIIIDEAHDIIMASDYRVSFKKVMKLTDLNVQIGLLTATLSPRSEVALLNVSSERWPSSEC